jgi:hypothetical protein
VYECINQLDERCGGHSVSPVDIILPVSHIQLPPVGRTSERSLANFKQGSAAVKIRSVEKKSAFVLK